MNSQGSWDPLRNSQGSWDPLSNSQGSLDQLCNSQGSWGPLSNSKGSLDPLSNLQGSWDPLGGAGGLGTQDVLAVYDDSASACVDSDSTQDTGLDVAVADNTSMDYGANISQTESQTHPSRSGMGSDSCASPTGKTIYSAAI